MPNAHTPPFREACERVYTPLTPLTPLTLLTPLTPLTLPTPPNSLKLNRLALITLSV